MISIVAFLLGAIWGSFVARRRGGSTIDIVLYAVVHGIILALLTVLLTVLAIRIGWV
ncbi:MAG: hypothetical protein KDA67_02775 [Rhodobacteraceae bacterium]|nr:hypothetical protein [Paracoccaceae bacterium]